MPIGGTAWRLSSPLCPTSVRLTPRQHQVLRLMAAGGTAESIARQLFVSLHTVKKTSEALYQRLGVHTQGAAVDTGYQLGFLTTPELLMLREMARLLAAGDVDAASDLAAKLAQPAPPTEAAEGHV